MLSESQILGSLLKVRGEQEDSQRGRTVSLPIHAWFFQLIPICKTHVCFTLTNSLNLHNHPWCSYWDYSRVTHEETVLERLSNSAKITLLEAAEPGLMSGSAHSRSWVFAIFYAWWKGGAPVFMSQLILTSFSQTDISTYSMNIYWDSTIDRQTPP